jgi:endonuclease YncB( thermonuclease family)
MSLHIRRLGWVVACLILIPMALGQAPATQPAGTRPQGQRPPAKAQPRPHGERVKVDPSAITVEDGDGIIIRWNDRDSEIIRIIGIDTPEVRRLEHNLPYDQPFGPEARAFAQGAFAAATEVEILRSPTLDPYDRTLAYAFINGRNYSVLAIKAGYSTETVSFYGDNGLPRESAEVVAAAKSAPPLPFEPPHQYRARMRTLTESLKSQGLYPKN